MAGKACVQTVATADVPGWYADAYRACLLTGDVHESTNFVTRLVTVSHDDLLRWGAQCSGTMRVSTARNKCIHRVVMARRRAYQNRKSAKLSADKNKANAHKLIVSQRIRRAAELYTRSMYANHLKIQRRSAQLAGFLF